MGKCKYIETRRLSAYALRALCIEHSWYTLGDNEEYDHLLTDLAGSKPHLDTSGIIAIAEDIAAHSVLPGSGDLICIKRGESGYYPSDWSTSDPEQNRELADFNNWKLGVMQAQRMAMENGSMFGWDTPGADPKAYELPRQEGA